MVTKTAPGLFFLAALIGCASAIPSSVLTGDDAMHRVAEVPEVRRWAMLISDLSKDEVHAIVMVEGHPEAPGNAWLIRVAENHDTHIATWTWFSVDRAGTIAVLDVSTDTFIPLDQWRRASSR